MNRIFIYFPFTSACIFIAALFFFGNADAGVIKGVYGAPSGIAGDPDFEKGGVAQSFGVNAVFVPDVTDAVKWYKARGYRVYIPVNVFGGNGAFRKYPDAGPIKANGKKPGDDPGDGRQQGVCPTHEKWREERLRYIKRLVDLHGGDGGIDGIFLDYIRYPGFWETAKPDIPDTCYCAGCLKKFQAERKIKIPAGLEAKEAAFWIRNNCPYEWMDWKKEQIEYFVREAKRILSENPRKITLGLFIVPWRKGEKNDAVSYLLAQDAFRLSEIADVISPMLYHKMCGRSVDWVGKMTRYYKETAGCEVWPIVQSHDLNRVEFENAAGNCAKAGADGILVFSYAGIKDAKESLWEGLNAFEPPENLIINSGFEKKSGETMPYSWKTEKADIASGMKSSFFMEDSHGVNSIGITSGYGKDGKWIGAIKPPGCQKGDEYIFSARFYRENWKNSVYPSVVLFGEKYYLDNHWKTKSFQPISVYPVCSGKGEPDSITFINDNPGETFLMGSPKLARYHSFSKKAGINKAGKELQFYKDFFPIGVYGADIDNLSRIKKLAVNTVIIGGEGEKLKKTIQKCHEVGLRYILSVPRDPDRLKAYLDYLMPESSALPVDGNEKGRDILRRHDVAFYVNDEPELTSFPSNTASDIHELIKSRIPEAVTCMALVRAKNCRDYLDAADFFMMDQYPVPNMPMTWLSDSIDEAASIAGRGRIVTVVQAFGGEEYETSGWPRKPSWREIDCLSFLSVVHGSRGIFYFTFGDICRTEKGIEDLGRVVGRLNMIYPWLLENNLDVKVPVEMTSAGKFDPSGRPAVHGCVKEKNGKRLIIAVNAIGTYVEAKIKTDTAAQGIRNAVLTEVFSGKKYPVIDGGISARFDPFEAKAFLIETE